METNRFTSVGNFTTFDLWDTYLIPYQMSFEQGKSSGSMCSYISLGIDGGPFIPACASTYLLNTLTRDYWGASGAYHTSDCGAVQYMKNKGFTANDTCSAAAALNGGMDLNSNTILPLQLKNAIDLGLTNETVLDASISRTLAWRFRLGQLDPLESQPTYMAFGAETIGAPENVAAAQEGSDTGLVLVKNAGATLPLKRGSSIAVLGPLGVANEALAGDYYADAVCPGATGYSNTAGFGCIETIAAAVARDNVGGSTVAFTGVTTNAGNDTTWAAALAAAASADAIILALGTDRSTAEEGTDLKKTSLPGMQSDFALAVLRAAAGKPVAFVLVSSFPMAFEEFASLVPAIVIAYTPGMGGAAAISRALFGANRWGRAVLTHYPSNYIDAVALNDFGIVPTPSNPGRTYRYYNGAVGAPLVSFGEGLSYNLLDVNCTGGLVNASAIMLSCDCTSTAGPDGDQVLHVYHRVGGDVVARVGGAHPIPRSTLVDFTRFALPAGATQTVTFLIDPALALSLVNITGGNTQYAGTHFLDVFDGSSNNETVTITLSADVWGRQPPKA
jgi:beta-D-xylosidase 4